MDNEIEHLPLLCYDTALTLDHLTSVPYRNIGDMLIEKSETVREVMRKCGADEAYITGDTSDYEKWTVLCSCMPQLLGHKVRQNIIWLFRHILDIDTIPSPYTADELWNEANAVIEALCLTPLAVIEQLSIETLTFRHRPLSPPGIIPECEGLDIIPLADFDDLFLSERGIRSLFAPLFDGNRPNGTDYLSAFSRIKEELASLSEKGGRGIRLILDRTFTMLHQTRRHAVYDSFLKVMQGECLDDRQMSELTSGCLESISKIAFEENLTLIIEDRGVSAEELTKLFAQLSKNGTMPITLLETKHPADFNLFFNAFTARTAKGNSSPLPVSRRITELSSIFPVGLTLAPFYGHSDILSLCGIESEYAALVQAIRGLRDNEEFDETDLPIDDITYGNIKSIFDGI